MTEKEKLILKMYSAHKRKKKIIICMAIFIAVVTTTLLLGYFIISSQSFDLKTDEIVVEYGEQRLPIIDDYVELNNDVSLSNTTFDTNCTTLDGQQYADVGSYDVTVKHIVTYKYKEKKLFNRTITKTAKFIVKDTTPPIFGKECPATLNITRIFEDENNPDLSKYFTGNDLSGVCDITLNDTAVDYKMAGTYDLEVVATDKSKNKSTMTCKVTVLEPKLSVSNDAISLEEGDKEKIDVDYVGEEKPKYKSSDKSIATVDENGTVKGMLRGKCYITVSCNGLYKQVGVNVKSKPIVTETTTQKAPTTSQNNSSSSNGNSSSSKNTSGSSSSNKKKYPNKDFLFTDGYTMNNVADAASDYLKESGQAGQCIPLKDAEGIYIGMRVEFD